MRAANPIGTVAAVRRFGMALVVGALGLSACGDDPADFETLAQFDELVPGDIIALRADGERVEYVERRAGRIISTHLADPSDTETLVEIDVGIEGEQRGLLGHTVIEGRRFAAWTDPQTLDLVVGEVSSSGVDRIVWTGTATEPKAIGGHLEALDTNIVLGLGSLTDWGKERGSGAIVTLDPDGDDTQEPMVVSDGWNNPFAFTVVDGEIWVADNAPDGSDLPVAEREGERIAAANIDARPSLIEPPPQRAPSAMISLSDGEANREFGVCGFLDNDMRRYRLDLVGVDVTERLSFDEATIDRAGTIGPCLSGAAAFDDGTIVTASITDDGTPALLIRRP